ncbi:MAG: IS982 family transposase, partial [Tannerella sp.]|nr:IS982 family transposase [Tannerella sp.]
MRIMSLLTADEVTEIFCIADDLCKEFTKELAQTPTLLKDGKKRRNRPCEMSDSEMITIPMLYHFGTFNSFKHFYLHYICVHLRKEFPKALSYNRF